MNNRGFVLIITFGLALVGCASDAPTAAPGTPIQASAGPSNATLLKAYHNAVDPTKLVMGEAQGRTGTSCSGGTNQDCIDAIQPTLQLAIKLQKVLRDNPAPACLGKGPADLAAATDLDVKALNDSLAALRANDSNLTSVAVGELQTAQNDLDIAGQEIDTGGSC